MQRPLFHFIAAIILLGVGTSPVRADWETIVGPTQTRLLESVATLPATFYASLDGNDDWSGKLAAPNADGTDGPFRTFDRAKRAARTLRSDPSFDRKPIVVEVRGGLYELTEPLTFDAADSGTEESPVIWRAQADADVILNGGRFLNRPEPVADPGIARRLRPDVRDRIVQFDLKTIGVDDFGTLDGENNAELFFHNRPMTLARYPNEGFLFLKRLVTEGTTPAVIREWSGIVEGKFYFDDEELLTWGEEKELWALGYWFWDWANSRQKIAQIDPEKKTVELAPPHHRYGYRIGQYYFVYNALCEIDAPGEFYIDRESGILYFYPPEEIRDNTLLLTVNREMVRGTDIAHFALCGFLLEGGRGAALSLSGHNNLVAGCTVRNVGDGGISVRGPENLIFGNHLYNLGGCGIFAEAGDRRTLTPGRLAVVNNDVHDYGNVKRVYAAGVEFYGCGNVVAHNRLTDAPHCGIFFGGNDQTIERNEIARVCFETNDAGAIYGGRDWTYRGNAIRHNYLHDITGYQNKGCVGVYLDDMFSSADIIGNLFVRVTRAAFIGGGRDNSVVNNLFIDCEPSIHVDARALGWCAYHTREWLDEERSRGTLKGIDYKNPPYSERYPKLQALLDGNPAAPEGNLIARNVVIKSTWNRPRPALFFGDAVEDAARPFITVEENVIGDDRLLFSLDRLNLPGEPNKIISFDPIPADEIGIFSHPSAAAR